MAAGSVARAFLEALGIIINSHVVRIGSVAAEYNELDLGMLAQAADSPVMCIDPEKTEQMLAEISEAASQGDTLGGVFEIILENVPAGIGSYVHWDRRLDGIIAQALASIPGIKGVEFGLGFQGAALPGSQVHDAISTPRSWVSTM